MKRFLIGAMLATACYLPVVAQDEMQSASEADASASSTSVPVASVSQTPSVAPAPVPTVLTLAEGTPIKLSVAKEVNSSTHREADTFLLTVMDDVKVGETVVVPRGTPATAEITWRTGKGAFGKSGKLEFSLRSIDLPGGPVPISGDFRQDGEGNTVATGVGVIAIGVFAGFITGKRARLPAGRELMSQTAVAVPFSSDGSIEPSFDGEAELEKVVAATPLGQCKVAAQSIEKEKKRKKATEKCYSKRLE